MNGWGAIPVFSTYFPRVLLVLEYSAEYVSFEQHR
jgi:hypothetical protein